MSVAMVGFMFGVSIGWLTRIVFVGWVADRDAIKRGKVNG